jgi:hypothetical protein
VTRTEVPPGKGCLDLPLFSQKKSSKNNILQKRATVPRWHGDCPKGFGNGVHHRAKPRRTRLEWRTPC